MAIQINGSTGVSGVNGTGANPVYSGGDSDTGIFFPALGQVAITTNGVQRLLIAETGDIQSASVLSFPGGSASAPSIAFTGDTDTGLYSPSANSVAISTNGTGRVFVDSSGNLLVGGTTAGNAGAVTASIGSPGSTVGGLQLWSSTSSASYVQFGDGTGAATDHYRGYMGYVHSTDSLIFGTSSTERLRITSDGKVGLGNSTPGSYNGAANDLVIGSHTGPNGMTICSQNNASGYIMFADGTSGPELYSGQITYDHVNNRMTFGTTDGTTGLTIDSSQKVGVGTTSPAKLLHVQSGSVSGAARGGTATKTLFESSDAATSYWEFQAASTASNDILFSKSSGGAYGIVGYDHSVDALRIYVNSSERARIDSSGRLLVGTSSWTGSSGQTGGIEIISSNYVAGGQVTERLGSWRATANDNNGTAQVGIDYYRMPRGGGIQSGVEMRFYTGYTYLGGTYQRMTLDQDGRLGIGTNTVNTTLEVLNSSTPIIRVGDGVRHMELRGGSTGQNAAVGTNYAGSFDIIQNGSAAVTIDVSKRVLVGTSSAADTATRSLLQVINGSGPKLVLGNSYGGAYSAGGTAGEISFIHNSGGAYGEAARIEGISDGATSSGTSKPGRLVFSTTAHGASSPTERMRISQSGTVSISGPGGGTFLDLSNSGGYNGLHEVDNTAYTIGQNSNVRAMRIGSGSTWLTTGVNLAPGGTSWGTYSDERLKTDIVELTDCLNDIKGIRCVSYRLTDVDDVNSKKRIGVIAQDLVGKYDQAINASRRSENDETEYLSVQYSDLIPVLLKALQEASVKIESLESRLTAAGI